MRPRILNLQQILEYYLKHQEDVVTRRTKYDLNKAEERAHILEGLLKALDHIDEVIKIIRGSANVQAAKAQLMERLIFGCTGTGHRRYASACSDRSWNARNWK